MKTDSETIKDYKELLESVGLKATHQRIVIYAALMQDKLHPSAESLYERLREQNPSLSLGTIYRTLESLYQHGLIQRVSNREGKLLFDSQREPHHHLFDETKNRLEDFHDEALDQLIRNYFEQHPFRHFEMEKFQIQIEGKFKE